MSVFHEIDVNGKHILQKVESIDEQVHAGAVDKGRMLYSKSDDAVYYGTTTDWVKLPSTYDIFPFGTKILMASYPLPAGFEVWTESAWQDQMIMFTSTLANVGQTPGTSGWEITGMQENGRHYHGNKTGRPSVRIPRGRYVTAIITSDVDHRHNITNDGTHSHTFDGSWKPLRSHYLPVNYLG